MTRSIGYLAGVAVIAAALSGPVFAQGPQQTVTLMKVDPLSLATGYRTSKVVGSSVVNEANETVGTIDDLIVTASEKVPFAVLSVGGFLGLGTKFVVIPFSSLEVHDKQMLLRGATKDSLKALPEFKYRGLTGREAARFFRAPIDENRLREAARTPVKIGIFRRGAREFTP